MNRRTFTKCAAAAPLMLIGGPTLAGEGQQSLRPFSIGFAPPVHVPLTSTTETRVRAGKGGEVTLTVHRRYQFEHFGRSFRLQSTITDVVDTAPPRLSSLMRAGVDPFKGLTIGFIVDTGGRVIDVENLTEIWAQANAAIAAMTLASKQAGATDASLMQQISAFDDNAKRAILLNEVKDLLRYAGRSDVQGWALDDNMASLLEQGRDGWRIVASVHEESGLSWTMDKLYLGNAPPRHGILGSSMQLSQ